MPVLVLWVGLFARLEGVGWGVFGPGLGGRGAAGHDGRMKWSTGVHHVEIAARACADMAEMPASLGWLRVTQLWAAGAIVGPPTELEWVTIALSVDLPAPQVPWWSIPAGAEGWADRTRLSKYPLVRWWRSARAPVWNHRIVRPVLVWDQASGVNTGALEALRDGRGAAVGLPEPTVEELAARLEEELAINLPALVARNREYEDRRWGRGGLEPTADGLWHATDGYLDLLAARDALRAPSAPDGQASSSRR